MSDPICLEPEKEPIPDCHASIDGCGNHPQYEPQSIEAAPCCARWNGNGNGDWCYFEKTRGRLP